MAIRFLLIARNQGALEEGLKSLSPSWSLDEIRGTFDLIFPRHWPAQSVSTNNPWALFDSEGNKLRPPDPDATGFGLALEGEDGEVRELLQAFARSEHPSVRAMAGVDFSVAPLASATQWIHWAAGTGAGRAFGTRRHAARLIGSGILADEGLTGAGVNVLVVDQGLSREYVESLGGSWGGGFGWMPDGGGAPQMPGEADAPYAKMPREHGAMIVRNVLAMAQDATIWDLPLIPPRIVEIGTFALRASFAILIAYLALKFNLGGRWVVVNAWGVGDRLDEAEYGEYTNNAYHPLNVYYDWMADDYDVVFAAGNSGQFSTDPHRAPYDTGPGRSIWGTNGLHSVLSVGAVRGETTWIGASSQGPGPPGLAGDVSVLPNQKPDLCAPSWFVEPQDASLRSGGTSAASAVAAGVVAALRENWSSGAVSPAVLRGLLRDTARRDWHTGWNGRMGAGILNVPGAIEALEAKGPGGYEEPAPEPPDGAC